VKIHQLRYFVSIVDNGFNISRAASAMHTSQPGISKQIRALENELGVELLVRRRTRVAGVTGSGKSVLSVARRMLRDAESLIQVRTSQSESFGHLVIATTHIYSRHVLLDVVIRFRNRYPDVHVVLLEGTPQEIAEMVDDGRADIGIGAEPPELYPNLLLLPGFELPRSVFAHVDHALLQEKKLSMRSLSRFPIVSLDLRHIGGATVVRAFEAAGFKPNIVLRAYDADVVKAYVARGVGVAVLPSIIYEPARDRDIRTIDAKGLFAPTIARIEISRENQLKPYVLDFITMLSPKLTRATVERVRQNAQT